MVKTFDPFDLEPATLKLGEHATYTIEDITEPARKKLQPLIVKIEDLDEVTDPDDARNSVTHLAALAGEMIEAIAVDGEGAVALLTKLVEDEKIGVRRVTAILKFLVEFISDQFTAGEG